MNSRNVIKTLVSELQNPKLNDVYRIDDKNSSIVCYLIKILIGVKTQAIPNLTDDSVVYAGTSGGTLLLIKKGSDGNYEGYGELAVNVNALLSAIRVHEIDSFEWVYLPPESRQKFVSSRADEVGVSTQEFKRLMSIWTASNDN